MSPDRLVGTWRLVSYTIHTPDHKTKYPFGPRARGYLMYMPEGLMSVAIMPEQPHGSDNPTDSVANPFQMRSWLSLRRLMRLLRYVRSATRYISYSGRYSIDGNAVIHHIEVSQMPGLIRTDQKRACELHGDRLTLTAETAGVRQHLVWERVPLEAHPSAADAVLSGLGAVAPR